MGICGDSLIREIWGMIGGLEKGLINPPLTRGIKPPLLERGGHEVPEGLGSQDDK